MASPPVTRLSSQPEDPWLPSQLTYSLIFCCLTWVISFSASNAAETSYLVTAKTASSSIQTDELKSHIEFLASDALEGREAGTQGGQAAGTYIRNFLQKHGVQPGMGEEGYFQEFDGGFRNILGVIPGNDPKLKNEYIVIGAHYDHVGYGKPSNSRGGVGQIHNGADDNASGTAALLEIIEAISEHKELPRRSILFAFWDAEEMGLLGSRHWMNYPSVPLEQIQIYFNLDMVGRLKKQPLTLFGSRSSIGLRSCTVKCNHRDTDLKIKFDSAIRPDSDHWPFYQKGIPFLMLHTGKHDDYHRPEDDAFKIDYAGTQKCAQLLTQLVFEFAMQDKKPEYRAADQDILAGIDQETRITTQDPPRLGVAWNADQYEEGHLMITQVLASSAADTAGLKVGDEIIKIDGRSPVEAPGFAALVRSSPEKIKLQIKRKKEDELLEIPVELSGNQLKLGIQWQTDETEPEVVVISNIIKSSPADLAGLKINDRIYEISGRSFESSDEFRELVKDLPLPLKLQVEREGRLQNFEVQSMR